MSEETRAIGSHEKFFPVQNPTLVDPVARWKRCPLCNHIETDYENTFCTEDGTTLVWDQGEGASTFEELRKATASTVVLSFANATNAKPELGHTKRYWIPVIVVISLLAILSVFAYRKIARNNNVVVGSLAVLPFLNVDADQNLEYLSDGMTDTLISNLSQLPNLNVKARSSVFRYKGKDIPVQAVGSALNVQAILTGRVVRRGDLLTLSLELVDAQTENVIWSEQYNRKQTDLVTLQNEIARDVSNKLRLKLSGRDEQKLAKNYTTSTEAYELYLKGRFYWNKRTLKDLEQASDYFKQAIVRDPNYALAYAGLADTYVVLPFYDKGKQSIREGMPPARFAAMKALSLDAYLAEAHVTLGVVNMYEYDYVEAEREYKRAIELKPNYATAHQWYGVLLFYLARHEESLAELRWALEIDPFSIIINLDYAEGLRCARLYQKAIAQLKKTLDLNPDFVGTHQKLGKFYMTNGNYAEAANEYATYRELIGDQDSARLIRVSFAKSGWEGVLRAITAKDRLSKLTRYEMVTFRVALGEKEQAFAELDKSYEVFGPLLNVDPLLDPLRDDPRFAEYLRRVGFR